MYDCIIIGSGPAGLSAAFTAKSCGLDYIVLERGIIAETVSHFPIAKTLFSTAAELELEPGRFVPGYKPTREELLTHYTRFASDQRLKIHTGEAVTGISRICDGFTVSTEAGQYASRTVLAAIGGFGCQRRLGATGENEASVSYSFSEAYPYAMKHVLVVGAGNSAAEAAIALAEVGAVVSLSIRRPTLDLSAERAKTEGKAMIKPWVRQPLDQAIARGEIRLLNSTTVLEIRTGSAIVASCDEDGRPAAGMPFSVPCCHIFALIGADPDTQILEAAGVEIAADGRPVYDPLSYETNVPGLFVTGHLTRERHMKNAIRIARETVEKIGSIVLAKCAV